MKIDKTTAKRLFLESPQWFKERLIKKYGAEFFEKRDFNDIKTFEDACEELGIDPDEEFNGDDLVDEAAYKKLKVIVAAINQGWEPDWNNTNQRKYWPYFKLSSGFGFSASLYLYVITFSTVGSRLCFETEEKCKYAATQFIDIYEQFLTIKK